MNIISRSLSLFLDSDIGLGIRQNTTETTRDFLKLDLISKQYRPGKEPWRPNTRTPAHLLPLVKKGIPHARVQLVNVPENP